MSASVNRVILLGNLGRDAEVRYVATGAAVAQFSMAVTETWKDKSGEKRDRTEWVDVELWGKRAEGLGQYLTKGQQVYVEGKLQTDEWTDKDGNKRRKTKVRADDIQLIGRPVGARTAQPAAAADATGGVGAVDDDSEIPF